MNTNRAQFEVGGGIVLNDEQGVDTAATQNVEGLVAADVSYYAYDRPRTNFDVRFLDLSKPQQFRTPARPD